MIGVIVAAAVVIVCMVLCVVFIRSSLRDSISSLGEMISRNQQASAWSQNETINNMSSQLNGAMAQVNQSLGEMRSLAGGVEELKKVISNVKTRGILGELQLGAVLEDILAPDQYEENVAVKGGSERVEFAVKFPSDDGNFVYLPIDSKFPGDAYLNLLDARELGDRRLEKEMTDGLRKAVLKGAKDIHDKYIYPPMTTDFAVMFLPFEGLYSEVLRLNIMEKLQREFRVTVAGPTTMGALLSSLRMGFRTIALRESADEVWDTLEKVKTEFEKFEDTLAKTQSKLEQTQKELELLVGVRTRSIRKALNGIGEAEVSDEE